MDNKVFIFSNTHVCIFDAATHFYEIIIQIANRAYNLKAIRHGPLIKFSPNHCEWSQKWCTIFTAGDEIIAAHSSVRRHTRRKMHLSPKQTHAAWSGASARPAEPHPSQLCTTREPHRHMMCSSLLHRRVSIKNVNLLPDFLDERTPQQCLLIRFIIIDQRRKRESPEIL